MSGENAIQTVGSNVSGFSFHRVSQFCGRWASRGVEFIKTLPKHIGENELRIGAIVLANGLFYIAINKLIAGLEKRYDGHDLISGSLTSRQKNMKQISLNLLIPSVLVAIFNTVFSMVTRHELSNTTLIAITASFVAIRLVFNSPRPEQGLTPIVSSASPAPGPKN